MKRLHAGLLLAVLALTALVVAACGGGSGKSSSERVSAASGGGRRASARPRAAASRSRWSPTATRARSGRSSRRAPSRPRKDEGVKLIWSPSNNDPQKEAQLIDAAVSQKVDGLAVSVPNASAIKDSLAKAKAAGIPIITLNSGAERLQGARGDHPRRPDRDDRRRRRRARG